MKMLVINAGLSDSGGRTTRGIFNRQSWRLESRLQISKNTPCGSGSKMRVWKNSAVSRGGVPQVLLSFLITAQVLEIPARPPLTERATRTYG